VNQWVYVAAGWAITVCVIVGYLAVVLMRGRRLSARVPAARRRWMDAAETDHDTDPVIGAP
jgi:hypothetical protein